MIAEPRKIMRRVTFSPPVLVTAASAQSRILSSVASIMVSIKWGIQRFTLKRKII